MLVLCKPKNVQIMAGENVAVTVADVCGINPPSGISGSLTKVRKVKVLAVRQQLADGKYDLSERLDIALDRLLGDIITEDNL